jgi:hypothetical protein
MFYHKPVARGTTLYLLLQLCEPTGDEYVQLVLVADRLRVANPLDPNWQQPLHLVGKLTVIPLDTAQLGPMTEFQVAVLPLTDATVHALSHQFTQAIILGD